MFAATALFGAVGQAQAGQLQIMPTRLGLTTAMPSTVLYATNPDASDTTYQLSVFRWSQNPDGTDRLDPTRDVLANPAIFTVKHADQQIIRFGLRTASLPIESSYRVILQELPRSAPEVNGIKTLLRISIPLFVPAAQPTTTMRWALRPTAAGATLIARNGGSVHVQITAVQIAADGMSKPPIATAKGNFYALPGITREIDVHAASPFVAGTTYHVRIDTDQGPMTADLRADPGAAPPAS